MATETTAATKTTAPAVKQEDPISLIKRTVVDVVAAKVHQFIESGELNLPANFSVNNALKGAWLTLQSTVDKEGRPALSVCTRDSIANSLLDMIVQGLNPMKKQMYFIVYGKTLSCQRSYFGSMAVAQMVSPNIGDFAYACVYEGDTFKYGIRNGKKIITEHEQDIQNVDKKKIIAAYCIVLDKNENPLKTEIMTYEEIKQAWKQSKMSPIDEKGNVKDSSTHGKFAADMCLKTVINKCCKLIINASSDNALLLDRINKNEDLADRAEVEEEIEENANTGPVLEIEAGKQAPEVVEEKEEVKQKEEPAKQETTAWVDQGSRKPGF
jgi:recombination protein RecT